MDQSGDNNNADVDQVEDNNLGAVVIQSGNFNTATVNQLIGNDATVDQSGDNNNADVNQVRDNTATVTQGGNNNDADVDQLNTLALQGSTATVNQGGITIWPLFSKAGVTPRR